MGRFDAVIFDMDGVLIDSEPLHFAVLRQLLARDGFELSASENDEFIGTTSEMMFAALIARHGLPHDVPEYIAFYDADILDVLRQPHAPQAGVTRLIHHLRWRELLLGVASSSRRPWIDATLASLDLSNAFDAIVSGDDVQRGTCHWTAS